MLYIPQRPHVAINVGLHIPNVTVSVWNRSGAVLKTYSKYAGNMHT